jgi:cyclopropane-fatty-acyl-phospholipid synthase
VGAEVSFRRGGSLVFQMQLAKAVETVPLTRDYIHDWERAHTAPSETSADRAA